MDGWANARGVTMRVGEILQRNGWVSADDLARALEDQRITGKRLCSLLVVRGQLDPDHAARALAEQFGVSAALTKHLEHRERALAKLLPANIARLNVALPLGRMRDGEIVICIRDPKPQLQAAFERILQKPVLITVACAHVLEPLIEMTYQMRVTQDLAVRFRPPTQPPPAPATFAEGTQRPAGAVEFEVEVVIDSGPVAAPQAEPDALAIVEPELPEVFSLVDLDDESVSKVYDDVVLPRAPTLPPGVGVQRHSTLPPANVAVPRTLTPQPATVAVPRTLTPQPAAKKP
jgi:hypothetical protein